MIQDNPNATLERFAYTPHGTFGILAYRDFECYTVERPWFDNEPNVSCIPEGTYTLELSRYNKGGYASYEIMNVFGRTDIMIHIGNSIVDVIGCVATGELLSFIEGRWAVGRSKNAYTEWMLAMEGVKSTGLIVSQYKPSGDW
tara:strand:+ start:64 stop:492 length:429 start_codon:yes stop_codon:yes gene_type:complete